MQECAIRIPLGSPLFRVALSLLGGCINTGSAGRSVLRLVFAIHLSCLSCKSTPSFLRQSLLPHHSKIPLPKSCSPSGALVFFFFHGARNAHTSKSRKRHPLLRHAVPVSYLSRKNKVNISPNPRFPQRIPPHFPSHPIRDVRRYFPGGCPQVRVNIS